MAARMHFEPDDEHAFQARRDELVGDYAAWLPEPLPGNLDPEDFGLLLDWRWGYGDGDLAHWRCADLTEFLLGWCPRKLVVPSGDAGPVLEQKDVPEYYSGERSHALDRQLSILERAGVIRQEGAVYTPRETGAQDRSGGVVMLTPVGPHVAVSAVEDTGIEVLRVPRVEDMGAEDLAAMVNRAGVGPEDWWGEVEGWVAEQPDARAAWAELVGALAEPDPLRLALALDTARDTQAAALEPFMRELAFPAEETDSMASGVALSWLVQTGSVPVGSVDPDRMLDAMSDTAALDLDADESRVVDMIGQDRSIAEQLDLVAALANRRRPSVERVLEALGRHHPDKSVSRPHARSCSAPAAATLSADLQRIVSRTIVARARATRVGRWTAPEPQAVTRSCPG